MLSQKMFSRDWKPIVLIFLASAVLVQISSALDCDDTRCRTGNCDEDGQCICKLSDPSTILDGDRPYLGGKFCDEEQVMCDGTNSFWCEHGATCIEIIQGENYTCKCQPGYTGEHCEHSGAPCGNMFCFHQAECIKEDSLCDCGSDWKGSTDCSLPTKVVVINETAPSRVETEDRGDSKEWLLPFLSLVFALGVIAGVVSLGRKFYNKRGAEATKFHDLRQVQMHGYLDEEDDDPYAREPLARGGNQSH